MDEQCMNCGHLFDIHHLKDGCCSECLDMDDDLENCPSCGSEAVGYFEGNMECFDCDHEW